jgi:hypothetical protein
LRAQDPGSFNYLTGFGRLDLRTGSSGRRPDIV